jgi:hypothetical protein
MTLPSDYSNPFLRYCIDRGYDPAALEAAVRGATEFTDIENWLLANLPAYPPHVPAHCRTSEVELKDLFARIRMTHGRGYMDINLFRNKYGLAPLTK